MKTVYIDCSAFGYELVQHHALDKALPGIRINVGDPDEAQLLQMLNGASGVLNGHTPMTADLLKQCPDLKVIVFLGTGASSYIDMAAATEQGIEVLTIRGYGNRTNAEHAFGLMLGASRNIASMDREVRQGKWLTQTGMELLGKRLGVIGTGGVGSELIKMGHAFGMDVVAWNRSPVAADLPCRQVALEELLQASDVVSLHLALNDATRGFLGKTELSQMKPGAIFVNVARGALVDEKALIEHLQQNRIRHAALDVFNEEPLPADHPFCKMDNVTLTAHAAFSSKEAMTRLLSDGFAALAQAVQGSKA